jgi:acetyl esterase
MLCALRPFDPRYGALPSPDAMEVDATLRFAVACWSVFDPLARFHMVQERQVKSLLDAHAAYWADEAEMAEGNPQLILERREAVALPPLLVIQGTRDDNLTDDMADRFVVAYRDAGGAVTLRKFEGMQHAFIIREPEAPASAEALQLIAEFIQRVARVEESVTAPAAR